MKKYLLAYHGGHQFKSKDEGMAHMQEWQAWMKGLGDAVVDPGMPLSGSKTVDANGVTDGGGANPLSGITVVQATSMDQALAMAKRCPHVAIGGSIEVAEAMDMGM